MNFDQSYEVSKSLLDVLKSGASGCFMWRVEGGRYFIKLVPTGEPSVRKEIQKLYEKN